MPCDRQRLKGYPSNLRTLGQGWVRSVLLFCLLLPGLAFAQRGGIPDLFDKIDSLPEVLTCRNDFELNNRGGHLQGAQLMLKDGQEYAILSGSSSTYAYYSVARLDPDPEVISVNILMDKPFKHAGGIQVFEDLLVVGIEDNAKKDKSKVCIYEIPDPEKPPLEPVAVISRKGEAFRSTAGCTAIARTGNGWLLVVGDWDTKHLDFYLGKGYSQRQGQGPFRKVYSMDMDKIDRSGWSDNAWHSYQNINLLKDKAGKTYLAGLGRDGRNENVADLYLLEQTDQREFSLMKLQSKTFVCRKGADFQSGAGIFQGPGGKLKIIGCSSHIRESVVLNVFD